MGVTPPQSKKSLNPNQTGLLRWFCPSSLQDDVTVRYRRPAEGERTGSGWGLEAQGFKSQRVRSGKFLKLRNPRVSPVLVRSGAGSGWTGWYRTVCDRDPEQTEGSEAGRRPGPGECA